MFAVPGINVRGVQGNKYCSISGLWPMANVFNMQQILLVVKGLACCSKTWLYPAALIKPKARGINASPEHQRAPSEGPQPLYLSLTRERHFATSLYGFFIL